MANKKTKNKNKKYSSSNKTSTGLQYRENRAVTSEVRDRVLADLRACYGSLYSDNPVYLHTHRYTIEESQKIGQSMLNSKESLIRAKVLEAWKKETQFLIEYCEQEEASFIKEVNSLLNKARKNSILSAHPNFASFDDFIKEFESMLITDIKDTQQGITQLLGLGTATRKAIDSLKIESNDIGQIGRKKNLAQLRELSRAYMEYANLLETIEEQDTSGTVTRQISKLRRNAEDLMAIIRASYTGDKNIDFNSDSEAVTKALQDIIQLTDEASTGVTYISETTKRKRKAKIKGKSVQGLTEVLQGIYTELFISQNINNVFNTLGIQNFGTERVGQRGAVDTTRDLATKIGSLKSTRNFNISVKSKNIKQQRASLSHSLGKFFEKPKMSNYYVNGQQSLFQIYETAKNASIGENYLQLTKYLIYSNLYGAEEHDWDLINDCYKILMIAHLNETLFGYGKSLQENSTLGSVLKSIPLITVDMTGKVVCMRDILQNMIDSTEELYDNILNKNSIEIDYSNFSANRKSLNDAKSAYINKTIARKGVLSYIDLKNAIKEELKKQVSNIENNVKITVKYNITAWLNTIKRSK